MMITEATSRFEDTLDDSDHEPEPIENNGFRYGNLQLVGHSEQTKPDCGHGFSWYGCLRVDLHSRSGVGLDGVDYRNKVFVKRVVDSCDKPSCPKCYKYGWATREARNIEFKLAVASKQFAESGLCNSQVEHVVCSPPVRLYGLSYEDLRAEAYEALRVRGVAGGVLIFHAFRYNKFHFWYFSPHFHVLGFLLNEHRCRGCERICRDDCDGFERITRLCHEKDGFIVKVLGKRKTVGGTAWYQLNHSSIDVSKKRFQVANWWGVCGKRKLKISPEVKKAWDESRKSVCPLCKHELVPLRYFGSVALAFGSGFPKKGLWMDFEENGQPAWAEDTRERWQRG